MLGNNRMQQKRNLFFHFFHLSLKFFITLFRPTRYLSIKIGLFVNFLLKTIKTGAIMFLTWSLKFKIVTASAHNFSYYGRIAEKSASSLGVKFKTWVVNALPTKLFIPIAQVFPVGDWLKYEEKDDFGNTALLTAIEKKDFKLMDKILSVCSQEALYRYLFTNDCIGLGPLQTCMIVDKKGNDPSVFKKILYTIIPEKRLWVLNKLNYLNDLIVFGLAREPLYCEVVMQSLPAKDRFCFMNQVNGYGRTPIMRQVAGNEKWENIKRFLDYFPKVHLIDYLNIKDNTDETFLISAVLHPCNDYIAEIIQLVPKEERARYLSKHNQGLKTLLHLKANRDSYNQAPILKKYLRESGLAWPAEWDVLSQEELKAQSKEICQKLDNSSHSDQFIGPVKFAPNEWAIRENFKIKHGQYPLDVLEVNTEDANLAQVKSAYKKIMLFSHPDKNNNSQSSTVKTQLLNEAYGVYFKADIREKYRTS